VVSCLNKRILGLSDKGRLRESGEKKNWSESNVAISRRTAAEEEEEVEEDKKQTKVEESQSFAPCGVQ